MRIEVPDLDLFDRFTSDIERCNMLSRGDTVVVGVSGGPDSITLLHLLVRLSDTHALTLHVAHLNHLLRGAEAEADAAFVRETALAWSLPCTVESEDVATLARTGRLAVEEAARQARYAFLARVAQRIDAHKIAVGHNADDQVETVLMHWLRGSGLAGLRGMQPVSNLAELRLSDRATVPDTHGGMLLLRPLLDVSRMDIEAYCAANDLRPRYDLTNLDTTFFRNRLRRDLLPFLETFNPGIRQVLLRSSSVFAAEYEYVLQSTQEAWQKTVRYEQAQAISFDLPSWRGLPLALQRSTLRQAIHRLRRSLRNINWVHVEGAIRVLLGGQTGAKVVLPGGLRAQLGYDDFTLFASGFAPSPPDIPLVFEEVPVRVPGLSKLPGTHWVLDARVTDLCSVPEETLRPACQWQVFLDRDAAGKKLILRPRRSADRFWPLGQSGPPTSVSSFMINAKIPRAWRDSIPLLTSPTNVLWVVGWRMSEQAKISEETDRVLVLTFSKDSGPPHRPGNLNPHGFVAGQTGGVTE